MPCSKKYSHNESVERYKSRLVMIGNTLLSVTFARNWLINQIDVHDTFLHGDLTREIYMQPPPKFHSASYRQVYHMKKLLYGLRQAYDLQQAHDYYLFGCYVYHKI